MSNNIKEVKKTGFEESLECEQTWPPRTFRVSNKSKLTKEEIERVTVPNGTPDTYNPLIPFSTL